MKLLISILLSLLIACTQNTSIQKTEETTTAGYPNNHPTNVVFNSNFSQLASLPRELNDAVFKETYQSLVWSQLYNRVSKTYKDGQDALLVRYPKGAVGPSQGGAQFVIALPEKEAYTLKYSVQFEHDFDFRLGGKLPGLTSEGAKWTGGVRPLNGQGWSARLMWREAGMAELYLYYIDMKGQWGESIPFDNYKFETGKWYYITQRIKVNDPHQKNAEIQIWINNKQVLNKTNFRLRATNGGFIDSLYFSTFHGGNQPKWGPSNNSMAYFGNFQVTDSLD